MCFEFSPPLAAPLAEPGGISATLLRPGRESLPPSNILPGAIATQKGLGLIVVLVLVVITATVVTTAERSAVGNKGRAAPEGLAAPIRNPVPAGRRPVIGIPNPEGIGSFTVTVNVWLDVLVTNLVVTTNGRPLVTVTVAVQPSSPVGLILES